MTPTPRQSRPGRDREVEHHVARDAVTGERVWAVSNLPGLDASTTFAEYAAAHLSTEGDVTGQDSEANADHTASRDVDDIAAAVGGDVMASRRSPRDMPDGEGVTNRAAPGARVGLQSNGHVHGATVNMVVAGATGDVTHTQDTISARMRADAERIREQAHRHAADAYRRAEQHMQHTANHHAAGAVSGPHVYGVQAPVTFGTVVISDDGITVDGEQLT